MSMNDAQLWTRLTEVFRAFFSNESLVIGPTTTAKDVEEWDSLNHVQLILAVEAAFAVHFKPSEVAAFANVGDMFAALQRHQTL